MTIVWTPWVRLTVPLRTVMPCVKLLVTTTAPSMKSMLPSSLAVSNRYDPVVDAVNWPDQTATNWFGLASTAAGKPAPFEP